MKDILQEAKEKSFPVPPSAPITRQQRRYKERIEKEAQETYNAFTDRFFKLFMESSDPEGEDLAIKRKQMNAQWRIFCSRMGLVPAAYDMFSNFCAATLRQYQEQKASA